MGSTHDPADGFLSRLDLAPTNNGPLDGLTFAVKDLIDVSGCVTGCGNPTWTATHVPAAAHAVVVDQLLNAGARCRGKTITDEFAFSLVGENEFYGTPPNPKPPDRVPGGSSSGSASVVAAGLVDFALGTDTAGSVRVPAANCGLFGLRPTWGRISVAGVQPLAPTFDTVGFLARDAKVLGRVAGVLLRSEPTPPPIRRVRMLEDAWALADPGIRDLRPGIEARLRGCGLEVNALSLREMASGPLGTDLFVWERTFSALQWPEIWSTCGGWIQAVRPELGPKIAENFDHAMKVGRSGLAEGAELFRLARATLRSALPADTALCLPTTPGVAPVRRQVDYDRGGTGYLPRTLCLTSVAGLGGLPQVSLPMEVSPGLPAGVSLVGAAQSDQALVDLARKLQA